MGQLSGVGVKTQQRQYQQRGYLDSISPAAMKDRKKHVLKKIVT
jgi:hypothetical protein